jgi:hypothetical protein
MPATPPIEYGPSVALTTRVMHVTGQWIQDTLIMPLPEMRGAVNVSQQYGAALTYARRYALTSMLGIVADEDVDGATIGAKKKDTPPSQPKKQSSVSNDQRKPTEKMLKKLFAVGINKYGDGWNDKRAELVKSVTKGRAESSKHLTFAECSKLIDGIESA